MPQTFATDVQRMMNLRDIPDGTYEAMWAGETIAFHLDGDYYRCTARNSIKRTVHGTITFDNGSATFNSTQS